MGGVAATIAALGNGVMDGDVGIIRVVQQAQTLDLRMTWDVDIGKWISAKVKVPMEMSDQAWSRTSGAVDDPVWAYLGLVEENAKWTLMAGGIPFAGALYAAGVKLQDRASGRMRDDSTGVPFSVTPWFYEFDVLTALSLDNDTATFPGKTWAGQAMDEFGFVPSTGNVGHGCVLKSDGLNTTKWYDHCIYEDDIATSPYHNLARGVGWDYVKFFESSVPVGAALGGVPINVPHVPTKMFLYPTLYGRGGVNSGNGVAAYGWEYRWSS